MDLLWIAVLSLAPGLLWLWVFTRYDARPEPAMRLLGTFALGAAATLPAGLLEAPFGPLIQGGSWPLQLLVLILVVGVGEEAAKAAAVYLGAFRSEAFDQVVDGIMYSSAAALGFAVLENMLYGATFGVGVTPIRAGLTSLAHVAFSGLFGFAAGLYKAGLAGRGSLFAALGWAGLFHGLYNFLLVRPTLPPVFALLIVGLLLVVLMSEIRAASNLDRDLS